MIEVSRRLAGQSLRLGAGLLGGKLGLLLTHLCAARLLPLEDYGHFALLFTVGVFLYYLLGAEQTTVVAREVAREPERTGQVLHEAFFLHLAAILLAVLGVWAAALFVAFDHGLGAGLVAWLGMELLLSGPRAALRAQGRAGLESLIYFAPRLALGALTPVGLLAGGLSGLGVVFGLCALVGLGTGGAILHRAMPDALRFHRPKFSAVWTRFRVGSVLAGAAVLATAYGRQDQLLLGLLWDTREVGLYAACATLLTAISFAPQLLSMVLLPYWAARSPERDGPLLRRALAVYGLTALATGLPVWVFADRLLEALFHLSLGAATLQALVAAGMLNMFNYALDVLLRARGKDRTVFRALAFGFLANLPLNLLLIPAYGATGAALATLASYGVVLFLQARSVGNHLRQTAS